MKKQSNECENEEELTLPWRGNTTNVPATRQSEVTSLVSDEEKFLSTSSIDACGNRLLESMTKLSVTSTDDIKAACEIGKTIQSLGRLKLDIYRTKKGLY